jgi:site-specific recombinase XerD
VKNITDYLEKGQVDQVLAAAHQCSTRDYLMLRVLWRTRVRVNELLTITPRDIEPQTSVVNVTKAKRGKQRRVRLDAETVTGTKCHQAIRCDGRERYSPPPTFRHSYAIHCVRNGWDIRRLQQVLGHSSLP